MKRYDYIDTDNAQEMTPEELKLDLNSIYGKMAQKKVAPEPRRRKTDVEQVDEMLISATILFCVIGAIFLLLGGLGL